jgi:hypothetical protein
MKLLTRSLALKFPPLESTDSIDPKKIIIPCKFILPGTLWEWYPTEFDGEDTFFGLVKGDYTELGYFTLDQLYQKKGPLRSKVERDKFFSSCKLSELL